jgi:SagB-type dehydrogenase family enzyme
MPALTVLGGRGIQGPGGRPPAMVDLAALGELLFLSAGVVRTAEFHGHPFLFRAAGSAGARFPLELYVSARAIDGLDDGVYWFDPVIHALALVGPPALGEATSVVVTGVPWRTGWRYAERGFRHLYWDAGTMLAQLLAVADAAGLSAALWTTFPDVEVSRLVGADGVHEFSLAVVGLVDGDPAIRPTGDALAGAVDAAPMEFPLVTATQIAGASSILGSPWSTGVPVDQNLPASRPLAEVILQRGSTRLMDPTASLPVGQLQLAMALATRGIEQPQYLTVHAVHGLEAGNYRWPDLSTPIRVGDLREQTARICLDQGLGANAAYMVFSCANVSALDDPGYRRATLSAGLVEGRLHLAAYALGAGASGMTFLDTEVATFLGAPVDALLLTCVGVPRYQNRPGGRPGKPVVFRPVPPRSTAHQ